MKSNTLAQRILARRKALGLTQKEVAVRVGVTRISVSKWETDDIQDIRYRHLQALSECFGCSIEWLVTGVVPTDGSNENLPAVVSPLSGEKLKACEIDLVRQSLACLDAFLSTKHQSVNLVQAAHSLLRQVVPDK